MKEKIIDITTIIVTFNSEKTIAKTLDSILSSRINQKIIVIDNHSSDNTAILLKKRYVNKITIIENNKNFGLTKAWNQGATLSKSEYLLFLNPDTQLKTLSFMKRFNNNLKNNKNIGVMGFHFQYPNGTLQYSAGYFPNLFRIINDRIPFLRKTLGIQNRQKKFYRCNQTVDWVSGSGFLVKKNVHDQIGGFDESMFMYGEDMDYCYRVNQMGYENIYVSNILFSHVDAGKTISNRIPHKYYYMRVGLLIFLKKHRNLYQYFALLITTKTEALFRLLLLKSGFSNKSYSEYWEKYLIKTITTKV